MAAAEDIVDQRDRFLALAFSASDLLMEVDGEGRVSFASGAVNQLTGFNDQKIKGRVWTDLFVESDRYLLKEMVKNAEPGRRCGPLLVGIQDNSKKKTVSVLFMALRMPGRKSLYVTLAFPNAMMRLQGIEQRKQSQENALIGKEDFVKMAQNAIKIASESGKEVDMTLLEMPNLQDVKGRLSRDRWEQTTAMMANLLKSRSVDGQSATQLSENRYGLLHDKNIKAQAIQEQVAELLRDADPDGGGAAVKTSSVEATMDNLSEKEVSRALMYTLNSFEKNGTKLTIQSLNEGLKGSLNENTKKIQRFKQMTVHLDFYLQFQPIVSLANLSIAHYEILTRFRDGSSPYEWITFGEEVGLAANFDMAVCTQAIKFITNLPQAANNKFAVNISGHSIESDQFVNDLRKLISGNKALPRMLMFEITESANIRDLEKVNRFIGMLQKDGFEVCLDDFGAGSASFQYLHKLHVNFVKLDGAYVQQIMSAKRNETMVRNLAQLCEDLKVGMVAEHIETEEEAILLRNMKIGFGQGYWFSKPTSSPEYIVDTAKLTRLLAG